MNMLDQVEMTKTKKNYKQTASEEEDESTHVQMDTSQSRVQQDEDLNHDQGFEEDNLTNQAFKRNFGNNFVFLFYKGEPLITIGPHWPLMLCMIGTFGMASYFMLTFIVVKKAEFWKTLSYIVSIVQMGSYLLCALLNPGIVTAKENPQNTAALQCLICKNHRSIESLIHCEDCDVCIKEYDHHCPWTGKCIGKGNLPFFYVFVTMIPIYIVYFVLVTVV